MQSCTKFRIFESWGLGGFIINNNLRIDLTDYANGLRNFRVQRIEQKDN